MLHLSNKNRNIMKTKEIKIEAPEGFEIDKENSTFEKIVFKEIGNNLDKLWKYHNTTEEEFNSKNGHLPKNIQGYIKEAMVVEMYNKGVKPDWSNNNRPKYYPYFNMDNFSCRYWSYFCSYSDVPTSSCFLRKEDLEEAVELYLDIYKESRL